MKELSIEEKAKRYDEALERAKKIYNETEFDYEKGMMTEIFPELVKSEDERIKKELIFYLRYQHSISKNFKDIGEWIAWLEKQGEHANFCNKIQIGDKVTRNEDGVLVNLSQLNRVAKKDEKQGEHDVYKESFNDGYKLGYREASENIQEEPEKYGLCKIEKQGEQKPNPCDGCVNRKGCINCENGELREVEQKSADKVELKFKVGDWVVSPNGVYWHIDAIRDSRYQVSSNSGGCTDWSLHTNIYHRFTIQDAKDGDVLACNNGWTCIFKTLVNDEIFSSYCFMDNTKWFCETGSECHTLKKEFVKVYNGELYPATKEQRDTLFAKMKEAGYEWDAEKKLLKKIQQNPAENKGMNLDEEEMTPFQKKVFCIIDTTIEEEQGLKQVCDELFALASNEIKQKPAWSREDEQNLNACFGYIPDEFLRRWLTDAIHTRYDKLAKWSEEDEIGLGDAMWAIQQARTIAKDENDMGNLWYAENWLKSLKERYAWKPSEEYILVIESCMKEFDEGSIKWNLLKELLEQLKQL